MTLDSLYSVYRIHYIWKLISSVWWHIHYMWYITQWLYLWYQTLYVHYIFTLSGITHSVITAHHCVPSQPLCLILYSKSFCHYTKCSNFMTSSECKSSQPLYVWHHMHYIWHHTHSLWHYTTFFMTSSPLCLTSHPLYVTLPPLYLCIHAHYINDITATLYVISHTVYMWHPTHYIYMISYPLCMTTQHCVLLIPLSAYVWHHLHYRWYHIHSITPIRRIYDVTSTPGMVSQPQYQTSHPLYLCHQNLSTDIIPTFV